MQALPAHERAHPSFCRTGKEARHD